MAKTAPKTAPNVTQPVQTPGAPVVSEATAVQARAAELEAPLPSPDAGLPSADTIDPTTLATPQLTAQGWVVPEPAE